MPAPALGREPSAARTIAAFLLTIALPTPALAMQLPPPPPEEMARIIADCRTPATATIPLTRTDVAIPSAPSALNLGWAVEVKPRGDAKVGQVVGVTRSWNGTIIAATDKGFWVRIPSSGDEAGISRDAPVASAIRDLPGPLHSMVFAGWSGEPGYVGGLVLLAAEVSSTLLRYQPSGCFPGARPIGDVEIPAGSSVFRLEPTTHGNPGLILRDEAGGLRWKVVRKDLAGASEVESPLPAIVAQSVASIRLPLARGCDQLTFHLSGATTVLRSSCSPNYLASLRQLRAKAQRQHRQPAPATGIRDVGVIGARVVAVSDAQYQFLQTTRGDGTVAVGDRRDPGQPCSFIIVAQRAPDAPITFLGAQPFCAYYPRGPDGAPHPPPPPPF